MRGVDQGFFHMIVRRENPKDPRRAARLHESNQRGNPSTNQKVFKPSAVGPTREMRGMSYLNDWNSFPFPLEGNGPTLTVRFSNLFRP